MKNKLPVDALSNILPTTFSLAGHTDYVRCLLFSTLHPWLFSGSDDCSICVWNWQSRSEKVTASKLSNFSPPGVYYPPSTGTPIGSPASPSTPPYHFSSHHHLMALRASGTIPGSDRKLPLLICFEVTCFFQSRAQNFLHNITSHSC